MQDEYGQTHLTGSQFLLRAVIVLVVVGGITLIGLRECRHEDPKPVGLEKRHDYLSVTVREGQRTQRRAEEFNRQREEQIREAESFDPPASRSKTEPTP